jgi:zinc transporter 2
VVGAVISVLIIWLITGILVYEAILRIITNEEEVNADVMLITACVGVYVNVL